MPDTTALPTLVSPADYHAVKAVQELEAALDDIKKIPLRYYQGSEVIKSMTMVESALNLLKQAKLDEYRT
jgi:hypothetical protein